MRSSLLCCAILFALIATSVSLESEGQIKTAVVDSAAACEKLGGTWQTAEYGAFKWRDVCTFFLNLEDCDSRGGNFLRNESSGLVRCAMPISLDGTVAQCHAKGGKWGSHCGRGDYCFFDTEQRACEKSGGIWECSRSRFRKEASCVQTSADGGRECTDSAECKFGCLYQIKRLDERGRLLGRCAATSGRAGCFTFLQNGRIAGEICED